MEPHAVFCPPPFSDLSYSPLEDLWNSEVDVRLPLQTPVWKDAGCTLAEVCEAMPPRDLPMLHHLAEECVNPEVKPQKSEFSQKKWRSPQDQRAIAMLGDLPWNNLMEMIFLRAASKVGIHITLG